MIRVATVVFNSKSDTERGTVEFRGWGKFGVIDKFFVLTWADGRSEGYKVKTVDSYVISYAEE
jgi:hypothetical protein